MSEPATLILTRSEIRSRLTLDQTIAAVERAFRAHAAGRSLAPGLLHIESNDGEFHIKAGGLHLSGAGAPETTYFALKANGSFFQNRARYGLPNIQGAILLFDGQNGYPLAIMDSIEITIQRTGAVTAVAARYLARPDSRRATICGCGNQGRVQLRALSRVLPIEHALAFDADAAQAERYADELSREMGIDVRAEPDLERAAAESDLIVTCTPSRRPYLRAAWVRPGTFISAIGADTPDKQELESTLLVGNKVVVDLLEQCAVVGELHHAIEAGLMTTGDVHAELGAVVAGQAAGRTSPDEITVFDATGTALQDAAAAVEAYRGAVEAGAGLNINLFE